LWDGQEAANLLFMAAIQGEHTEKQKAILLEHSRPHGDILPVAARIGTDFSGKPPPSSSLNLFHDTGMRVTSGISGEDRANRSFFVPEYATSGCSGLAFVRRRFIMFPVNFGTRPSLRGPFNLCRAFSSSENPMVELS
jgi:hypothetical protein